MLGKEEIDAVSVVVPTSKHEEVALEAIDSGKHVLVEKPLAQSAKCAERIVRRANRAGVNLMVGHIERFNPVVGKIKKLIDEGQLGKIVSISAKRVGPYANVKNDIGVCLDLAIHDIDVMRFLTNDEVSEVYAKIGNSLCLNEDYASILLALRKGTTGLIETNWLTPTKIRRLDVTGTKGYAELDYITQELHLFGSVLSNNYSEYENLTMTRGYPHMAKMKMEKVEPLKLELEHFIQSILSNTKPAVDGRIGIRNLEVALAAVKSARKGCVVSPREVKLTHSSGD
jgi:UDP-N-acetylglucosamine 3-dehydrogenase